MLSPRPSICCSPPDSVPAATLRRSARRGNASNVASMPRSTAERSRPCVKREEPKVLDDCQRREDRPAPGHLCDPELQSSLGVDVRDVGAPVAHAAPRREAETRDDPEQGGLPRAVRPEQRDHLAVVDGEGHVEEHLQLSVGEVDAAAREHRELRPGGGELSDFLLLDDPVDEVIEVARDQVSGRAQHERRDRARGGRVRRSPRTGRSDCRCPGAGAARRSRPTAPVAMPINAVA